MECDGWSSAFLTNHEFAEDAEDKPVLKAYTTQYDGESILRTFMRDQDECDNCVPHADVVEGVCGHMNETDILSEESNKEEVALLDDREFREGDSRPRSSHGPLTARRLNEELAKPVSPRYSLRVSSSF